MAGALLFPPASMAARLSPFCDFSRLCSQENFACLGQDVYAAAASMICNSMQRRSSRVRMEQRQIAQRGDDEIHREAGL